MPPRCSVCDHDKRAEIDRLLLGSATSLRDIARQFDLSKDAVQRHKENHLPVRLVKSQQAAEQLEADSLLDKLRLLNTESLDILRTARKTKDHKLALSAIGRLERQIELEARLIGQLADVQVSMNLVASPEWLAVRTALLRALDRHPGAREDVLRALGAHHAITG